MKDKDSHLIYEAYIVKESSIENQFAKQIDVIAGQIDHGSRDDFDVRDFLKFKSHIKNWETLEAAIDQENTYGSSHLWDEIQFTEEYLTEEEPPDSSSSELTPDKQNILHKLQEVEDLLPDDAHVQWQITNGQFSGVTPYALGNGNKPEDNSINAFKHFLTKIWDDPSVAAEHGLENATYHGYTGEPFWIANDTNPKDVFGDESMNRRGGAAEGFEDTYREFRMNKYGTEAYLRGIMNGKPPAPVAQDITKDSFKHQNDWRIVLSASSELISTVGKKTANDVYPDKR